MAKKTYGVRAPKRMTLVLPARTADRLDRLQALTDASSATEVILNALLVYEVIAEAAQDGGVLMHRNARGHEQILPVCIDVEPAGPLPGEGEALSSDETHDSDASKAA